MAAPLSFLIPWHASLITRSLLHIALLLLCIAAGATYFTLKQIRAYVNAEIEENIRNVSHVSARSLGVPLWNLDEAQMRQQLTSLAQIENFCGARIRDTANNVLVDERFPAAPSEDYLLRSRDVYFANPVSEKNNLEKIGTLDICLSLTDMRNEMQELALLQIIFLFVVSLAILGANYWSLRILSRPLSGIRRAMDSLAHSMIPITEPHLLKPNEIGALAFSFNQMATDLKRTYEKLEKANEAKSDFLAHMSHELRTPLNSILGMTQLLAEENPTPAQREMLQTMLYASEDLLEIVNDILDISKIEAGHLELESIAFNPFESVAHVVNMLLPLAGRKELALSLYADRPRGLWAMGDPTRYTRIVTNLIGNAIKYTERGRVDASLFAEMVGDSYIRLTLEVADTGIGIPEDKLGAVFEKFVQADVSTTRKYGGSGLGLAITKQLVQMMGGTLGVRSVVGKGSVFTASIPFSLTEGEPATSENASSAGARLTPAATRLLIAEDHALNQIYMRKLLASVGLTQFKIVDNGRDALEAATGGEADIVLMDCHMPILNGYEATREIRRKEEASGGRIPILALTANAVAGEKERCLKCGMDDFLTKPLSKAALMRALSRWVRFDDAHPTEEKDPLHSPSPILDMSVLRTFSEGNASMEKEFASVFFEQSRQHLAKLAQLCAEGVCEPWKETAHLLKGGAATMGALRLREQSDKAQQMLSATKQEREAVLASLTVAFDEVCKELRNQQLL